MTFRTPTVREVGPLDGRSLERGDPILGLSFGGSRSGLEGTGEMPVIGDVGETVGARGDVAGEGELTKGLALDLDKSAREGKEAVAMGAGDRDGPREGAKSPEKDLDRLMNDLKADME